MGSVTRTRLGAFAYYVLPLLAWMLLIFSLSNNSASADVTRPMVGKGILRLLPFLRNHLSYAEIDAVNFFLRKCAHVTEYAILATLAYRAVAFGDPKFRSRNIIVPWLLAATYAASDEYHQTFYASRGPSVEDVFVDAGGASLGLLICLWNRTLRAEKAKEPDD
jgi:VanZ family protein